MVGAKLVNVNGVRYLVRGISFEELVKLGSNNVDSKRSREVVVELVTQCLIEPRLTWKQVKSLPNGTLSPLISILLDFNKGNSRRMNYSPIFK